jgi:hypothetical protein
MKSSARLLALLLIVGAALETVGCGKADKRLQVFPVTGHVYFQGTPVPLARIRLYPLNQSEDKALPRAWTDETGAFSLSTYKKDDGAPAGEYQVSLKWVGSDQPPQESDGPHGSVDLFEGRFTDPKFSGITLRVSEGSNDLDIQLD